MTPVQPLLWLVSERAEIILDTFKHISFCTFDQPVAVNQLQLLWKLLNHQWDG